MSVTRFVLATRNPHKVDELRAILGERLGPHELVGLDSVPGGGGPEPIEDGDSFAANALIKARAAFEASGLPAIADDSGIAVRALGGAPGIHSARYAGGRDDRANLELLLANLDGVADRAAGFWCAAALVDGDREIVEVAEWPGEVLVAEVGAGGFGYDPIFRPLDSAVSAAELTAEQKNARSHRALAFAALVARLRELYG